MEGQTPHTDDPDWEQNFNDLIQYKKKYGDTKVPRNWSDNPQLAEWVGLQRIYSSDFICNRKKKHLTTAERITKLKSIAFDFYVYHTNRTPQIDAYLKSNPSKKHPALDVASKEDAAAESTGEVEDRDLDAASTGKAIKSNLLDVPTLYMPIDVCDTGLLWNCARIVKVEKNKKAASTGITHYVTVHYEGWPADWDEPMAWPSPLLAERYTYTKKAKCFIKLDGIKGSWPCKVVFRMPHTDKKVPRDFLRKEKRVYIEPYMPTLLPSDVQEGLIDQRGHWTTVGRIVPWRDFASRSQSDQSFESSVNQAHKEAQADRKVSRLPLNALLKGALIRDEYHTKREGGDPPIITDGVICHGGFDTSIKIEHHVYKKTKDKTPSEGSDTKWEQHFNELKEYKKHFGDTNVSFQFAGNSSLANWVHYQRKNLRKFVGESSGRSGHISEEKIRKLLSIGFVFNPMSNHPKSEAYLQKIKSQMKSGESEDKKLPSLEGKVEVEKSDRDDSQPESLHPNDEADDNQESTSKVVTRGKVPQGTLSSAATTRRAATGPPPPTLPPPILINDIIYPNQGVRRVSNGWAAVLNVAGNDIFLGTFPSQTEAAYAVRLAKEQSSRGHVSTSSAPSPFARPNAGNFTDIMNMPIESVVSAFEKAQKEGYEPTFNLQEYMSQREQYIKHHNPSEYKRDYSYLIDVKPAADGNVSNNKRKKSTPQRLVGGLGS